MRRMFASVALVAIALFFVSSPARADQRLYVGATVPVPLSSATLVSSGVAVAYDVVHVQLAHGTDLITLGLAPVCTVENAVTYSAGKYTLNQWRSAHVEGGLLATFSVWRVTVGAGEILRPGETLAPALSHWSPSLFVGVRL